LIGGKGEGCQAIERVLSWAKLNMRLVSFPHLLITTKPVSMSALVIFAQPHPMPPEWEVFCGVMV